MGRVCSQSPPLSHNGYPVTATQSITWFAQVDKSTLKGG